MQKPQPGNPPVARGPYGRAMSQAAMPPDAVADVPRSGDGMPRNYLKACLLLILSETSAHGYDLADQLGRLGLGAVDKGGMYRTLRTMEDEGLLASAWERSQTGPLRRRYRVTAEGRSWLEAWTAAVRSGQAFAALYLRRYERARRTPAA